MPTGAVHQRSTSDQPGRRRWHAPKDSETEEHRAGPHMLCEASSPEVQAAERAEHTECAELAEGSWSTTHAASEALLQDDHSYEPWTPGPEPETVPESIGAAEALLAWSCGL